MFCIFNVAAVQYAKGQSLSNQNNIERFLNSFSTNNWNMNSIQFDSILSGLLLKPMPPMKTFCSDVNLIVLHFNGNSTKIHYFAENWVFKEKISIKCWWTNDWSAITIRGARAIRLRSNTKNTHIPYMHRRPCLLCIRCHFEMCMFGNLKSLNGRKQA